MDMHCHVNLPEVASFLEGDAAGEKRPRHYRNRCKAFCRSWTKKASTCRPSASIPSGTQPTGIWPPLIEFRIQKLVEMLQSAPSGRFAAFSTIALQFPELAAKQMEDAMKMGLKGAAIGGHVEGERTLLAEV